MALSRAGALAAGIALFALPFLQSGLGDGGHGAACAMDHEPRHGGRLTMLGEYHLEIVEREEELEVYLSDLGRRPLRAEAASVAFDDAEARALEWRGYRLVAARPATYAAADFDIAVAGRPPIAVRLPRTMPDILE